MAMIYFARHGETEWNTLHKICGRTDVPLTEKGREEAKLLSEKIKSEKIALKLILHSPLKRAAETAKIVSENLGIKAEVEPLLIERDCGIFEGKLNTSDEFLKAKQQICNDYGGGESMLRVSQRIFDLLDKLTKIKTDERSLLLIGHNGIARSVEAYFNPHLKTDEFIHFFLKNCELRRYEF